MKMHRSGVSLVSGIAALAAVLGSIQGVRGVQANISPLAAAPLYFEADGNGYIARGQDCSVWLRPTGATMVVVPAGNAHAAGHFSSPLQTRSIGFQLIGANPLAKLSGADELPGKANYFLGNDPSQWRTGVPLFSRVEAHDVYPGVQMIYHPGLSSRLEFDFALQPGANPRQIGFRITGADRIALDAEGNLVLGLGPNRISLPRPLIWEVAGGARKEIPGGYRIRGETVGFWIGDYDSSLPLMIDPTPTVGFLTFAGGSKLDIAWGVAVDAATNIYIAGETLSKNFTNSTVPGFTNRYAGGSSVYGDAFVAKYDSAGALQYLTYLGGRRDDGALDLAVDPAGNAYVTGFTDSTNFPLANPIRSQITGPRNNALRVPNVDAFVAKLDPTGANLLFSTFIGGGGRDEGLGIALDPANNVYVGGYTESTNGDFFPPPNGFQTGAGGRADAFVVKMPTDGTTNGYYATFLGGTNLDYAQSIAVDAAGDAFITGLTLSTNFPTTNSLGGAVYTNLNTMSAHSNRGISRSDAFLSKFSPDGTQLLFSSFIGGSNNEAGLHVTVDGGGNAYVTGYTFSTNGYFVPPVTALLSTTNRYVSRVFVVKLDTGNHFVYSTEFGGRYIGVGTGISVDGAGNAYVIGNTTATNFFGTNAFTDLRIPNAAGRYFKHGGTNNMFIAVLDPTGAAFVPGKNVLLGGSGNDIANAIIVAPDGTAAYIAGQTSSTNLATPGAAQPILNSFKKNKASRIFDGFVGKIQF